MVFFSRYHSVVSYVFSDAAVAICTAVRLLVSVLLTTRAVLGKLHFGWHPGLFSSSDSLSTSPASMRRAGSGEGWDV